MLMTNMTSSHYKHEYFFEFQNKQYRVHSIVRVTEEGRCYLGSKNREVILTEVFMDHKGVMWWKYEFASISPYCWKSINKATTRHPDDMLETVVIVASTEYAERQMFGVNAPSYNKCKKVTKKDWEIPEVVVGWIIFILVVIAVSIFKDWYVKMLIRGIAGFVFARYRQFYIDAYTTYECNEDFDIEKKKYDILK